MEEIRKMREILERINVFANGSSGLTHIGMYKAMNGIVLVSDNCFGQIASIPFIYYIFSLSYHLYFMRKYMCTLYIVQLCVFVYLCLCEWKKKGDRFMHHSYEMLKQLPFWCF